MDASWDMNPKKQYLHQDSIPSKLNDYQSWRLNLNNHKNEMNGRQLNAMIVMMSKRNNFGF
jgi:hypothetical protein